MRKKLKKQSFAAQIFFNNRFFYGTPQVSTFVGMLQLPFYYILE